MKTSCRASVVIDGDLEFVFLGLQCALGIDISGQLLEQVYRDADTDQVSEKTYVFVESRGIVVRGFVNAHEPETLELEIKAPRFDQEALRRVMELARFASRAFWKRAAQVDAAESHRSQAPKNDSLLDHSKPQVIVRARHCFRGDPTHAVPMIHVLANRAGFRSLGAYCMSLAGLVITGPDDLLDPDNHQHFDPPHAPYAGEFTDEIEVRLGVITPENESAVFKKYSISAATTERGCITRRYPEQVAKADATLQILRDKGLL